MLIQQQVSLLALLLLPALVLSFSVSSPPVSTLLEQHASSIASLKAETAKIVPSIDVEPYSNDVFYLRYCLDDDFESDDARVAQLQENLQWRIGDGKAICDAAQSAIAEATAGDKWNNEPVYNSAPFATKINQYLTPKQTITTTTSRNDLIFCICAGKIDDTALMASLDSPDEMTNYFVYSKEVNACVANKRSLESDKMCYVLVANDLSGVKLIGGDAAFRTALSDSSKIANNLYPSLNGPSLLLNLPRLLGALVKLFTPLFPEKVRQRLKFESGPLKNVDTLMDIVEGGKDRQQFLNEIDKLVYDNA